MSINVSLRLVVDTLDAWAVHAEEVNNSPYAAAIHGDNYRDRAANYRDMARHVREAIAAIEPTEKCIDRYRNALLEIVDPIKAMQMRLEPGETIDGLTANKLADSGSYLRGIAKEALGLEAMKCLR